MGLFSTIFGSAPKPEKSKSGNQAYPWLMSSYGGWAPQGGSAMSAMSGLLGLGGGGGSGGGSTTPGQGSGYWVDMTKDGVPGNAKAARAAGQDTRYWVPTGSGGSGGGSSDGGMGGFENFLNNSGYGWVMDQGMRGVSNSAAGKYLLRSGATAKALQDRAMNISKTYLTDYLDNLARVAQLSLGAGSLISNAGQWSKGTGATSGSQGLLSTALQVLPFIPGISDPKAKTDIKPVGKLTVYDWRYNWDPPGTKRRGFMADEVEKVHPQAMGPKVAGFRTIDPLALVGAR